MLLNRQEQMEAVKATRELILAGGSEAKWLRPDSGQHIYGRDECPLVEIETLIVELNEKPRTELNQKIDATGSLLPDVAIQTEDVLEIGQHRFRVQGIKEERLFGVITHLQVDLVLIHGR